MEDLPENRGTLPGVQSHSLKVICMNTEYFSSAFKAKSKMGGAFISECMKKKQNKMESNIVTDMDEQHLQLGSEKTWPRQNL